MILSQFLIPQEKVSNPKPPFLLFVLLIAVYEQFSPLNQCQKVSLNYNMILLVPHICFEICVFFRFGSQFCKSDETFFYAQAYEYFIAAYFTQQLTKFLYTAHNFILLYTFLVISNMVCQKVSEKEKIFSTAKIFNNYRSLNISPFNLFLHLWRNVIFLKQ